MRIEDDCKVKCTVQEIVHENSLALSTELFLKFAYLVLCEHRESNQNLSLLLLFTAIGFSPGGSSPYTSTHNTNVFTRWQ
jgi:hypothetical protein